MAASQDIAHIGKIVDITPEFTTVEIISHSACSSCHAEGLCGMSDAVKKAIQLPTVPGNWTVGQEVNVMLRKSMGFKAVWLAYMIPLLVLLAVLLILVNMGVADLVAGLIAIGAVAFYYLVLALFRNKLANDYSFYIKEK